MPRPQRIKEEEKTKYEFPEYTKEQLKEFEQELEKYRITKPDSRGKEISFYDDESYLKDIGALTRNGAVAVTGYETRYNRLGEPYPFCDYPSKYEIIRDKIEKLYKLQGKKEYAQKMNQKETDESILNLADEMKVVNETKVNDL